jgi:hypothetical protein
MFKKIFVALLVSVLAGSTLVGNAADTPDESFTAAGEPGLGYMGYTAYPVGAAVTGQSGLLGMKTSSGKVEKVSFCKSTTDSACSDRDFFQFLSHYPLCELETDLDCIEAITAANSDGKELVVSNLSKFSDLVRNQYLGSAENLLPSGGVPTLFTVADAPHGKGTTYMASVSSFGSWDKASGQKANAENAALAIYAVEIKNGNFGLEEMSDDASRYLTPSWRNGNSSGSGCKYTDGSKCAVAHPIPTDIRFGLKVRNSAPIKGWFHGRVQDPQIQYSSGAANSKTLAVSAYAVKVPGVSIWKKKEELSSDLNYFFAKAQKPLGGSGSGAGNKVLQEGPQSGWSLMRFNNEGYTQSQMDEFLAWIPLIGDKANLLPTVWTMNLMTGFNSSVLGSACVGDAQQLTGMVSTNATQYLAGPPTFNPTTEELEYKVAGPHLLPNGELSRGTYDLSLRADFARCLYGISGTAIKATISIISDNGTSVNAVSTVTERNGWLNFSAKGFTFSAPTIKVKLTSNSTAKKTTITCTKGKVKKKVTGVTPKCPTGYKKAK